MTKNQNKQRFQVLINQRPNSKKVAHYIKSILIKNGWILDKTAPQYLFIIGGDGTLVRNLRYYYHKAINIVSINTGNIGFYAHFHRDDFKRFMEDIMNSENYSNPYLLEIYVNDKHLNAINEMTIQSLNTISIDITINDIFYETCKGTGVMICTRTGSTGWGKSVGGAVIMPNVDAYELIELSPTLHVKNMSVNAPLILNHRDQINLTKFNSNQRCDLIIDGMRVLTVKPHDHIKISLVKSKFKLCFNSGLQEYISKLQKTFIKI